MTQSRSIPEGSDALDSDDKDHATSAKQLAHLNTVVHQLDGCISYQNQVQMAALRLIRQYETMKLELDAVKTALSHEPDIATTQGRPSGMVAGSHQEIRQSVQPVTMVPETTRQSVQSVAMIPETNRYDILTDFQEVPGSPRSNDEARSYQRNSSKPDMKEGALDLRSFHKTHMSDKQGKAETFIAKQSIGTVRFSGSHPFRSRLREIVETTCYGKIIGAIVIVSVVLIGVEIEYITHDPEADVSGFWIAQIACLFLFAVDIVLRLSAYGSEFFGCNTRRFRKDWKWNVFDVALTISMAIEITSEIGRLQAHSQARMVRVFRLLRVVRALKVLRESKFAREFRKMAYAIQYSLHTLTWSFLLLSFVVYFFATTFTQAVTEKVSEYEGVTLPDRVVLLRTHYGSIPRSFLSLYQATTGGRDWHDLFDPLCELPAINPALFILYIFVTVFGVANILTSVFVETVLASAKHYKEMLIQDKMFEKQIYKEHLKEVFSKIDADHSGQICIEEMQRLLSDPAMQQYLESIDIDPDSARSFFKLLDKDLSDLISLEEFCEGCLCLKGQAKSFDVHCMIYENNRMLDKWQDLVEYLDSAFLPKIVEQITERMNATKILPDILGYPTQLQPVVKEGESTQIRSAGTASETSMQVQQESTPLNSYVLQKAFGKESSSNQNSDMHDVRVLAQELDHLHGHHLHLAADAVLTCVHDGRHQHEGDTAIRNGVMSSLPILQPTDRRLPKQPHIDTYQYAVDPAEAESDDGCSGSTSIFEVDGIASPKSCPNVLESVRSL